MNGVFEIYEHFMEILFERANNKRIFCFVLHNIQHGIFESISELE